MNDRPAPTPAQIERLALYRSMASVTRGRPAFIVASAASCVMADAIVCQSQTSDEACEWIERTASKIKDDIRKHWPEVEAKRAAGILISPPREAD